MDVFPTLMNLVGGKLPDVTMDGMDMAPILFNNQKVLKLWQLLIQCVWIGAGLQSNRDFYIYYPDNPDKTLCIVHVARAKPLNVVRDVTVFTVCI